MNQTESTTQSTDQLATIIVPTIISIVSILSAAVVAYIQKKFHTSHKKTRAILYQIQEDHGKLKASVESISGSQPNQSQDEIKKETV